MEEEMVSVLDIVEDLRAKICSISQKVDVLTIRFRNMKNDRDRLKAKLDLLNLPDRPCGICRNQVYGRCRKRTCEWKELR